MKISKSTLFTLLCIIVGAAGCALYGSYLPVPNPVVQPAEPHWQETRTMMNLNIPETRRSGVIIVQTVVITSGASPTE